MYTFIKFQFLYDIMHFEKVQSFFKWACAQILIQIGCDFKFPKLTKKFMDSYYIERNQNPEVPVDSFGSFGTPY